MAKYNHDLDIFVMHRKQSLHISVGSLKLISKVLACGLIGIMSHLLSASFNRFNNIQATISAF